MSEQTLARALGALSDIQRSAVEWNSGPLLLLAGPGSGKTQVLTCRIARLLDSSRDKSFRVLALTFTNKAANEMAERVQNFVPGLEERATIGTFHSFCTQVLRQHGVHIDIKPDFAIFSQDADRAAVLEDALQTTAPFTGKGVSDEIRYLPLIDRMKSRLISVEEAPSRLTRFPDADRIAKVYRLYEEELRKSNALDFNSLILECYRLFTTFPAIAQQYHRSHPYWLLDEFQDTNGGQYQLIKAMAGSRFKNIFAVADDDQIIYQWNGASFRQLQRFRADFNPELMQLPTNYRCPPVIVSLANKLVSHNLARTEAKEPLIAGKVQVKLPPDKHIRVLHYRSDVEEAESIASDIVSECSGNFGAVAVLARNKSLLQSVEASLDSLNVPSVLSQRKDDFASPLFRWMVSVLRQSIRPTDKRVFKALVEAHNRLRSTEISFDRMLTLTEVSGDSYWDCWAVEAARLEDSATEEGSIVLSLIAQGAELQKKSDSYSAFVDAVLDQGTRLAPDGQELSNDVAEDIAAWKDLRREINHSAGRNCGLDQFLQELGLRSKEPPPKPGSVSLMTIHASKGREFDYVYVIGFAEDVLPSFQSRKKGDDSAEMEEERRNCFVAITRAKEALTLSFADTYRGYKKAPSRFLVEMELLTST